MSGLIFCPRLSVHRISDETFLRFSPKGKIGSVNQLNCGEFYSFSLIVKNTGKSSVSFSEIYVVVDDGEPWGWAINRIAPGNESELHIFHCNMKKLSLGIHCAKWYMDGKLVCSDAFLLTEDIDWNRVTSLPSSSQIASFKNLKSARSPYVCIWMELPAGARYKEYSVDFKADYLPRGTYCALGNWSMDLSSLQAKYRQVQTQGISAYAGFQNIWNGEKMAIMSFWDLYCIDHSGNTTLLRAKVDYPYSDGKERVFDNEGVGAQCITPFYWEEKHWYRMHLRCFEGASGTTFVEMWAADLETGQYTLISRYDTRIPNSAFVGNMAIFLENYEEDRAGEIRTLEIFNAKYLDSVTNRWCHIRSGTFYINGSAGDMKYTGSYDFGVKNGHLWMMSTGLDNFGSVKKDSHVKWSE